MSSTPSAVAERVAVSAADSPAVARAVATLRAARERTLALVAPLGDDDATRQHDPLMSPIVWDLGHIAAFESLWLLRNVEGPIEFAEMPGTFNPFETPRASRGALALPSLAGSLTELASVRAEVERKLPAISFEPTNPLLRDAFVVRMVAQHERQHQETILQTLQLKQGHPYRAPRARVAPRGDSSWTDAPMVRFPGGRVTIGTDDRGESYDNERPRHAVRLSAFEIDATPVTNGAYRDFVEDGGYDDRALWSNGGWAWRCESEARAPKHWERDASGWVTRSMDSVGPLDATRPVCHVCWHEAEAYAKWVGKRLPTEAEWEAAATWDPAAGRQRTFPWGDEPLTPALANVDQVTFDTAPVGSYPRNVSPIGCYGMIGDVWEWTASDFVPYPGYDTFPYPEYSEVFFGAGYKVLRGGSWATGSDVARTTFRNWDYPIRRQIFSGFRCARDV